MFNTLSETETVSVEDQLDLVRYPEDDTSQYMPTNFALDFINFIKLVNGSKGEENLSPIFHYKILDGVVNTELDLCNMIFRGSSKTAVFGEYMFLYLATYGKIEGFGKISLAMYISDSIENGIRSMRNNLEFRYQESEFLQEYVPHARFTETRWVFKNIEGNRFIVKGFGAKCLTLDSKLFTDTGYTTIGECKIGDYIFGSDGKLTKITLKSPIQHRRMFCIELRDGRKIQVTDNHLNSIVEKTNYNNTCRYVERILTTSELAQSKLFKVKEGTVAGKKRISRSALFFIKNCAALEYTNKNFSVDPYTLGLILGDGSIKKKNGMVTLHAHRDDLFNYQRDIPYALGVEQIDKRNPNVISQSIRKLGATMMALGLNIHGDYKFIPKCYLFGSVAQRTALLQGLMDTDGTVDKEGRCSFSSNSFALTNGVIELVRSLGGTATVGTHGRSYRVQIRINILLFRLSRKFLRQKDNRRDIVGIKSVTEIPTVASQCIAVDNSNHEFITEDYVRTHNTGIRGNKELGTRPQLAVMDDLVSDDDARSETVIARIEDTIYKAVEHALNPNHRKIIWSGTPFNANDPLYKAVSSGGWKANVFPVCEEFPCAKEDFRGAWGDRFNYDAVLKLYTKAERTGKIDGFYQELMLRIISDEERLVKDSDIIEFDLRNVLKKKTSLNYYITTDFANTPSTSGDYGVICVWGYTNNGDWLLVDGVCKKQEMNNHIDDLFRLSQKWVPQSVGIEVSGQQGGFISWIQTEMVNRNIYFNLENEGNKKAPGVRPIMKKEERFIMVVPLFKLHKIWIPEIPSILNNANLIALVQEMYLEIKYATAKKLKAAHDDVIDNISMLGVFNPWKPSEVTVEDSSGLWIEDAEEEFSHVDRYVV